MRRVLKYGVDGFVLWVLLFSAMAWFFPVPFKALQPGIVPGLGIIMFGMGMGLSATDFLRVLQQPRAAFCGILGQFLIMPLIAWFLTHALQMPPELQLGFIILGCCPGGTASNVIVYLARGNVALSVTMTACSTLLAVLLTPILVKLLGSTAIPVDAHALFKSVVLMVFIPVTVGVMANRLLATRAEALKSVFPLLSVLIIVLVIAAIVAASRDKLPQASGVLFTAVLLHNALGLGLGYALARICGLPRGDCRTVAIEVGMQNSGLGVALASSHFGAFVALPSSVFSVVHNVSGSALASYWRRNDSASARNVATEPAE